MTLEVLSLAGTPFCTLQCSPQATVSVVKRRIARASGISAADHHLVHSGKELRDDETLEGCIISDVPGRARVASVQCIRSGRLSIARSLEAQSRSADPDVAIQASSASIVDTLMRSEHLLSERHRPRAGDFDRAIQPRHRAELINWMVQAFDVLRFDNGILHSVVMTLDRYYSTQVEPIEVGMIQRVLLAAVCIEMKLAGADDFPPGHWQRVVTHLCHGRIDLRTILQTEYQVLSQLRFQVWVPTPVTFLRELGSTMLGVGSTFSEQAMEFALFLLELCAFEPELQYRRPHAVLAAGALSGALRALEAYDQYRDDCMTMREAVLEDVVAYSITQFSGSPREALGSEEDLLQLWLERAFGHGGCSWAHFYQNIEAKFVRRGLLTAANVGNSSPAEGGISVSAIAAAAALQRLREA